MHQYFALIHRASINKRQKRFYSIDPRKSSSMAAAFRRRPVDAVVDGRLKNGSSLGPDVDVVFAPAEKSGFPSALLLSRSDVEIFLY